MELLLSGYYGFGNVGDDALARVIVSEVRKRHPAAAFNVLSAQPERTARELNVTATPRFNPVQVRNASARADVVLSGGGGLLQNSTSLRSLIYYAGLIRAAVRAGKKTMIFAQSIGPLDFWGKRLVRNWCKGVRSATVRDRRSEALLGSLLKETRIERAADPAFLYEPAEERADLTMEGLGPGSDPLVIVSVRKTSAQNEAVAATVRAVDRLAEKFAARVAFLPLGGAEDAEVSTTIIRKCKSTPVLLPISDLDHAARVIARAHAVIGMRLHALIFAVKFGVPFLALAYDPKVSALCEDLAYPLPPLWDAHEKGKAGGSTADALVDRLMSEHDELARKLSENAATMAGLARRNFDLLDELIEE